jgi:flagellin-specific chaperone FliS
MASEETEVRRDGANSTTSDSLSSDGTNQSDGNPKYQTAQQKIDEFTVQLEAYLDKKAIPRPKSRKIDDYLNMTRHELGMMSDEDVGEIAVEISCYAYYMQDIINQQLAKAEKCRTEIERLVGPLLSNYKDCYGKEEKWIAAINDNIHATRFRKIEDNSRIAVTRMSYLSARLDTLAKSLLELQATKRRRNGKI